MTYLKLHIEIVGDWGCELRDLDVINPKDTDKVFLTSVSYRLQGFYSLNFFFVLEYTKIIML